MFPIQVFLPLLFTLHSNHHHPLFGDRILYPRLAANLPRGGGQSAMVPVYVVLAINPGICVLGQYFTNRATFPSSHHHHTSMGFFET